MKNRVGIWALGLIGSLAAHVAILAVLMIAVKPEPVTNQPLPTSELEVLAYQLDRTEAREQQPESQQTDANTPEGQSLNSGAIPQSRAKSAPPKSEFLRPDTTRPTAAPEIRQEATNVEQADPARTKVSQADPTATAISQVNPPADSLSQIKPDTARLSAFKQPLPRLQAARTKATVVTSAPAPSTLTAATAIQPEPALPVAQPALAVAQASNPVSAIVPVARPSVATAQIAKPDFATLSVADPAIAPVLTVVPDTAVLPVTLPSIAPVQTVSPKSANLPVARPSVATAQIAKPDFATLSVADPAIAPVLTVVPDIAALPVAIPAFASAQTVLPRLAVLRIEQPAVATSQIIAPVSVSLSTALPSIDPVQPATAQSDAIAVAAPVVVTMPDTAPQLAALPQTNPRTNPVVPSIPEPTTALLQQLNAAYIEPATPSAKKLKAALAFSGGDGNVDPVSIAAFQSFMQPGDIIAKGDQLRDSVSGLLAQVPCSRMQVAFDPDTATLQVNGHIPDDDLRAPVLAALRAQMGANITVSDNILILPRPQCGALSGIAGVGLPQSTDQITNPLVIGEDAHARVFSFATGDLLSLDMTAPDYDAYIYLDYFDAAGSVLHLEPNEYAPLRQANAQAVQQIGAKTMQENGLKLVIGPPYGQEIAVAFAASESLYDGLRPIQEPAAEYLQWLKLQVESKRAENPDFKGEWVYFFVSTTER